MNRMARYYSCFLVAMSSMILVGLVLWGWMHSSVVLPVVIGESSGVVVHLPVSVGDAEGERRKEVLEIINELKIGDVAARDKRLSRLLYVACPGIDLPLKDAVTAGFVSDALIGSDKYLPMKCLIYLISLSDENFFVSRFIARNYKEIRDAEVKRKAAIFLRNQLSLAESAGESGGFSGFNLDDIK